MCFVWNYFVFVLLNPLLNSFDNFALSPVDEVTIGTKIFSLVIVKVEAPAKLHSTQFGSHVNESSTLKLINGISNGIYKRPFSKYYSNILVVQLFLHHFYL